MLYVSYKKTLSSMNCSSNRTVAFFLGAHNGLGYPAENHNFLLNRSDLFDYIRKGQHMVFVRSTFLLKPWVLWQMNWPEVAFSVLWNASQSTYLESSTFMVHCLHELTGSLPELSCYNALVTKKIRIRKPTSIHDAMQSLPPSLGSVTACVAQMVCPFFSRRVQV